MDLYVYMREPEVYTLGPGKRYVLWVSGCDKHCPGCIAEKSHERKAEQRMDTGALAWEILASGSEGITISGGEPFLQAEALCDLLQKLSNLQKGRTNGFGTIIYTGRTMEEIQKSDNPWMRKLLDYVDLLIDGEYIRELDDGKSLRGSSNQRVIPLSDRYIEQLNLYGQPGRNTEHKKHRDSMYHIGIPYYIGIPTDTSGVNQND